jgi:hypothetical protein
MSVAVQLKHEGRGAVLNLSVFISVTLYNFVSRYQAVSLARVLPHV